MGPKAGRHGGELVGSVHPKKLKRDALSLHFIIREKRNFCSRYSPQGKWEIYKNCCATGNNLKNLTVEIPLGMMICVTGVSGMLNRH